MKNATQPQLLQYLHCPEPFGTRRTRAIQKIAVNYSNSWSYADDPVSHFDICPPDVGVIVQSAPRQF